MALKQSILINSKDRKTGTAENFTILLAQGNIGGLYKLSLAQIPLSFYNINSNYNTLQFNEGGPTLTAVLPSGNYRTSGAAAISTALQAALNLVGGQAYVVVYNQLTNNLTITAPGNFTFTGGSLYPILGLTGLQATGVSLTTGNINLSYISTLYLRITQFNPEIVDCGFRIFNLMIPLQGTTSDIITYEPVTFCQTINLTEIRNIINVQLIDQNGNPVILNNQDFYFVMTPK